LRTREGLSVSRSLSIVTVLFVLCALALWMIGDALPKKPVGVPRKFDQHLWAEANLPNQAPGLRHSMVADLIAHHLPLGTSKLDVDRLLGHPDQRSDPNDAIWQYHVRGEYTGDHVGDEKLELRFDSNLALQSVTRVVDESRD
jgi:hypothetical protein